MGDSGKKHYKSDLLNSLVGTGKIGKIKHQATVYGLSSLSPFKRRVFDAFQKEFPVKKNKGGLVTNNFKGTF